MGIGVNIVLKKEHAPEIEPQNRVIQERARGIMQTLPYKRLPKRMRTAMIQCIMFWLNNIPREDQNESSKEVIMGDQILDTKMIWKIPFRAYTQVHDDNDVTNTMLQTTGGINLGPNKMNRSYKFLNLEIVNIIVRRKWTELPLQNDIITRLEELADDPCDDITLEFEDD
jgi:hypothetical protein